MVGGHLFDVVAAADNWRCWLCGDPVDPELTRGPWSPTMDHVTPRRRGGKTAADNLRLAHRSCNNRRGAADPEVGWPPELGVTESADLFSAAVELARSGGTGTRRVVGWVDPTVLEEARAWLLERIEPMIGGRWYASGGVVGGTRVPIELECTEAPAVVPELRRRGR